MRTQYRPLMSAFLAQLVLSIGSATAVFANSHEHARPDSLSYLDQSTYVRNLAIRAHIGGDNRRWKLQMMNIGERRLLFQGGAPMGDVIDVTDPLNPVVVNEDGFIGRQIQLAYNSDIDKWILMTGAAPPLIRATEEFPHAKYDDPDAFERTKNHEGLRGVRFYDASNPRDIRLLSEFSSDLGEPARKLQTGGGTHRDYYDGGKYAYLDTAPDDSFIHQESSVRVADPDFTCYTFFNAGLQCYDISDPQHPFISSYFIPPQGGSLDQPGSYTRNTDNVFIEWDRKLIWVATDTGLYLLTTPEMGDPILEPLAITEWNLPRLNEADQ